MADIRPTDSLLAAISNFTEARAADAASVRAREDVQTENRARDIAAEDARAAEAQRVRVSSSEDVELARENVRRAEDDARFRREAPTAGREPTFQPPGQIVDIEV